jgi:hypothetical protein
MQKIPWLAENRLASQEGLLHAVSVGVSVNKQDTSNAGQNLLYQKQERNHYLTACSFMMWPFWIIRGRIIECGGRATGKRIKELCPISQGGNKFVSSPQHPDWLYKQPILLSSADQGLFLLWVKQLANIVLKLRSGEIPPIPYAFMLCTGTNLSCVCVGFVMCGCVYMWVL